MENNKTVSDVLYDQILSMLHKLNSQELQVVSIAISSMLVEKAIVSEES